MADTSQMAVRIDNKGRVTLPKNLRKALGLETGDTVFLKYDPKNNQVLLAPAVSPFDILVEHAIKEYREGRTKTVAKDEDQAWLEADLGELPPYDWGPEGPPKGKPVRYKPGVGLIVEGGK